MDGRDPIEKMNQLRAWLLHNKVESAPKAAKATRPLRITGDIPKPSNAQASREIVDFENWVNDIQSPAKAWLAP
jgi:hypothetical protein